MEHLWYQLNVTVDPADPVAKYHLTAHTFSYNTLDIHVPNPTSETVNLQVYNNFLMIECVHLMLGCYCRFSISVRIQ